MSAVQEQHMEAGSDDCKVAVLAFLSIERGTPMPDLSLASSAV